MLLGGMLMVKTGVSDRQQALALSHEEPSSNCAVSTERA
jgi:hypothetical protein